MKITVSALLYQEFIWNKERVQIHKGDFWSEITRLEFQYEAIDNDYEVCWIEPGNDETDGAYLILHCEDEEEAL